MIVVSCRGLEVLVCRKLVPAFFDFDGVRENSGPRELVVTAGRLEK